MRGRHIHRPGGAYDRLLRYMGNIPAGAWANTDDVADRLGMSVTYARDLLRDAVDDGLVEKPSHRSRRWRLIQAAGEHADSQAFVTVTLTRNQAVELIRASVDREITWVPGTGITDRVRYRALHAGRAALTEALGGKADR
jgi:hypothetical protein